MRKKGQLCQSCTQISHKAAKIVGSKYKAMTQYQLNYVMTTIVHSYDEEIVVCWFNAHAKNYWKSIPKMDHKARMKIRRGLRERAVTMKESETVINLKKFSLNELPYLQVEFDKKAHRTQKLLNVRGSYTHPELVIKCLRCYEDFSCSFENFKKSKLNHFCKKTTSSGEIIVRQYLEQQGIDFVVQRDTLNCRNPITGYQLPYDFEITKYKILIEVQGKQHYEFIPYLQQTEENFEYQVWKDSVKKEFAEEKGYIMLVISYRQLDSREYKSIIQRAIKKRV